MTSSSRKIRLYIRYVFLRCSHGELGQFWLYTRMASVLIWLHFTGMCLALSSTYSGVEYAGGCFGVMSYAYKWEQCANISMKVSRFECLCTIPDVLQTTVGCIDQLLDTVTSSDREVLRRSAYEALTVQCETAKLNVTTLELYHKTSDKLQPYDKERPMNMAGYWKASKAFKLDIWECQKSLLTYHSSDQIVPRGLRACAAVLAYWAGVLLIRFLAHWTSVLFPRTGAANTKIARICRRVFTLPALFKTKHSEAVYASRYIPLNVPTREQTLIILGFVAVHIGLTFGFNPHSRDSYFYGYDDVASYNAYLAFRVGKMAVYEIPLAILFAGRNNFLQWLTGWSHDTFVVYHKWIARCIGFSVLTHAATYTVARLRTGAYKALWSVAYWKWGVASAIGCCVIVFQGMAAIRRLHYEAFLIIHILLALLFIIGGYYHLKLMNEELQYFYATFAVWGFDRAFRVFRVLLNNPCANATVELHGEDTLEMTVNYSRLWKPQPGNYAFIHIVQPMFFWESHPFTLSLGVKQGEDDRLKLFCRVKDGMTRRAMQCAKKNGGSFTTKVWIDGPYGPSYNIANFDEALFIAGGIGITAPFSYIHGMLQNKRTKTQKITLYWVVRDDSALQWFKDQLEYMNKSSRVNVNVVIGSGRSVDPDLERENALVMDEETGKLARGSTIYSTSQCLATSPSESNASNEKSDKQGLRVSGASSASSLFNVGNGGMSVREIVRGAIEESHGSLGVLCCGPGAMNDDCRYAIANGLSLTSNYVEYFEESFSW